MKSKCLDDMRAYLGLPPYAHHVSRDSGVFYSWCIKKYGEELMEECIEELKSEDS